MRIVAAEGENNLAELARRLFEIEGAGAKAQEKLAVGAIRDANPHLQPSAAISAGTPVVVPNIEGLKPMASAATSLAPSEDAVKQLKVGLQRFAEMLEMALAEEVKREDDATAQLKEHEEDLKTAGLDVADRLDAIKAATTEREKELPHRKKLHKLVLNRMSKDVETIAKLLSQ